MHRSPEERDASARTQEGDQGYLVEIDCDSPAGTQQDHLGSRPTQRDGHQGGLQATVPGGQQHGQKEREHGKLTTHNGVE